jgi:alkylation response protein AidB-like acyl-CoA dehydrogenase
MFESTFNFDLDETLIALRDSVRHFAQKEIAPIAAEVDSSNEFPVETLVSLALPSAKNMAAPIWAIWPTPW